MNSSPSVQINVGATEARSHFAEMLKRVHRGKEHLIIEKGGIAVAALISMREYDDFLRWRAQQELHNLGQTMAAQAQSMGMNEEELAAALELDRQSVYDAHYRSRTDQ